MKNKKLQKNRGMTYVELIVVLGIFGLMSSIILFNYGKFQAKVDISNLANDIALKITEAQKSSMSGKWNVGALDDWKPSYGAYFSLLTPDANEKFTYFADLNSNKIYNPPVSSDVVLDTVSIAKGNFVSALSFVIGNTATPINDLSIIFTRPDSGAVFAKTPSGVNGGLEIFSGVDFVQIAISSPKNISSCVKIYPSGRIQINNQCTP